MAQQNDINIGLNVTSNGTIKQETNDAQKLAETLKSAEKSATGTSKALSSAKSASASRARTQAPTTEEKINYGISRAAAGTGAASRDFANQSQGLGGLVRLYATFAANIFALTAAFTALSSAADTTNLVKGLDQLGAASGRALGSLSKKLADASEGAISLRDSMESVAKASSAGLSDKQILQLGNSAKQASQALGLSMPDALSRLTRGISKLEPELLDELGIFIRIDDATQKYALSIGKSASSLSDFERRQAFANAVLDQAKDKFGDIKLDVNPYSKLLATFQNVTFQGLELVNKVLGPVVKLLAESPTALSAVLATIGVKLFSTAIPALGQWRNGLKLAAEEAAKTSDAISKSFGDEFQGRLEASFRIPGLERNLANAQKEVEKLKKSIPALPAAPVKLAPSFASAADDEKGLAAVNRALADRQKKLVELDSGERKLSAGKVQQTKDEVAWLTVKQQVITKNLEIRKLENKEQQAALALEEANNRALTAASQKQGRYDTEVLALKQAEKARLNYDKIAAVSNAVETTRILGVRLAWQALNNEITDKGIKGIDRYTTLAKGGLASIGTRVLGIAASFTNLIPAAAAAFAVFEIASLIFSKNDKESAQLASSIEDTTKAVETLNATYDKIAKKDPFQTISIASITALSTALSGVTESLESLVTGLDKADKAASGFDKLIDGFLIVVGKDLRSKFTKAFVPALVDTLESLPEGEAKEAFGGKLKSIIGITELNLSEVQAGFDKLSPAKLIEVSAAATEAQKEVTSSFRKSADGAQSFKDSLSSSVKAYQELSLGLSASDPISKLGQSLATSGIALDKTLQNTTTGISGLIEILNDSSKLSLLPENTRKDLIDAEEKIRKNQASIVGYTNAIKAAEKEIKNLQAAEKETTVRDATGNKIVTDNTKVQQESLRKDIAGFQQKIITAQNAQASIVNKFLDAGKQVFSTGIELLGRQIESAKSQAALSVYKAQTQQATGFAKIGIDASIQKQEIDIQLKLIDVQERLVVAQTRTNLLLTENALQQKKTRLEEDKRARVASPDVDQQLSEIARQLGGISNGLKVLDSGAKNLNLSKLDPATYEQISGVVSQMIASQAQRISLSGQRSAVSITEQQKKADETFKVSQDSKKAEEVVNNVIKDRYTLLSNLVGIDNQALLLKKQQLEVSSENNTTEIARAEILRNIVVAADTLSKASNKDKDAAQQQVNVLRDQLLAFDQQVEAKTELRKVTQEIERIESRASSASKELAFNTELAAIKNEIKTNQLEAEKEYLDYLIKSKVLSEEQGIVRNSALEKELLLQKQLTEEAGVRATSKAEKQGVSTTFEKAVVVAGGDKEAILLLRKQEEEQLNRINTLEDARINKIREQTASKLALLDVVSREEAQYAKIDSVGKNLAKIFEGLGDSATRFGAGIGNVLKTFTTTNARRVASEKDTQNKLKKINTDNIDGIIEYYATQEAGTKRAKELEIDAVVEQAGAAKTMFAEKTFAYKAFSAVERTLHIAKMAMMAVELATTVASVGPTVAAETTKAWASGKAAIAKALNLPPPAGFIAGAAMAAIVAALLGGAVSGGGSTSIPAGLTAKEVQETQGTGTAWVNGKKVETGGGVFGDASAKSDSINKSIEIIKETSVEGITYSNKMVELLTNIDKGISGVAQGIYGTLGVRTGSAFGTTEGTTSSGIRGLFGSSKTVEIIDSGIKILGTFKQLAEGGKNAIQQYETTKTTKTSSGLLGLGGSTKTSSSTKFKELEKVDAKLAGQISTIFSNATELLEDAGSRLGMTAGKVSKQLESVSVNQFASLRDLKGEELEKEFNSIISSIIDDASLVVFDSLKEYRKFGEGMLQTVTRVLDGNEKVNQAFKSIGKEITISANIIEETDTSFWGTFTRLVTTNTEVLKKRSIEITENLIDLAGGLEDFLDRTADFKDNFLSESEKLVPVQEALTEKLKELGFSSLNTREEFKSLVLGLDLTTQYGRNTYTSLMEVQEAFTMVYASTTDINNSLIELIEAQDNGALALAASRAQELDGLSDVQKAIKLRVYALEDELDLKDKLIEARDAEKEALESSISSIKNYIKTLADFKLQLLGGASSILTPEQKYKQARSEAQRISTLATGPANTLQEIEARNAALDKLPSALQTFLDTSKTSFASSAQYVEDFNSVMSILDATGSALEAQKTDQEKQLDQLIASTSFLGSIDSGVKSLADLAIATNELLARYTTPVVDPVAIVRESITNANNVLANMRQEFENQLLIPDKNINVNINNEALIAEVRGLKAELQGLREDNARQAETIVTTNAVVTRQAAEMAAAAAEAAAVEAARQARINDPITEYGINSGP